jgi:hypothetical protein
MREGLWPDPQAKGSLWHLWRADLSAGRLVRLALCRAYGRFLAANACGGLDAYDCRRPNGAPRFRCRACKCDFSIASGTLFASHKLPLRAHLAAIAIFCNEVKGKSALALSRDLGVSYKCAFVLGHKLREAMAEELKGRVVGGEGKVAEVDGGYFGGYVKPRNLAENRVDRRLSRNQSGKRKVVVIVRERNGNSVPAVFRTEGQAQSWIKARVAKGTVLNADEATSWDGLHGAFEIKRINHQEAYTSTALARIGRKNKILKMRTDSTALMALAAALPPIALRTLCLVRLSAVTSPEAFDISVQRLNKAKPFASVAFWR